MPVSAVAHAERPPWQVEIRQGQNSRREIYHEIGAGTWSLYAHCHTRSDVVERAAEQRWECSDCDEATSERVSNKLFLPYLPLPQVSHFTGDTFL